MALNRNMPRIDNSRFSMIPSSEIPRSKFITTHSHKTTFDTGLLVPIFLDEVLPGDVFSGEVTIFARLATPVFPIMDAVYLETFFFFVPNRLVWENWVKMMGERKNPSDSISYTVPVIESPDDGYNVCSVADYMGLPTIGQLTAGESIEHSALPIRAYRLIFNEWFRDQNLQNSLTISTGNGPDNNNTCNLACFYRNKKHDYFTSALPWPLKGGVEIGLPMGGQAPVRGIGWANTANPSDGNPANTLETDGNVASGWAGYINPFSHQNVVIRADSALTGAYPEIYADLTTASGATINGLRMAIQTQRLLERDARSGTRYTELLHAHFRVNPEDSRLQRPEYIGGGRTQLQTQAIPQTSATGLTGGTSPLGALGAASTFTDQHDFRYSATEHGHIIGLVNVNAELTYQQGLHKLWNRQTRYDFYWPVFAHLGEQAITNKELVVTGEDDVDDIVFGYQERWAEYRHRQGRITGMFKSTTASNIDTWHLAIQFGAPPILNENFLWQQFPFERVLQAGESADNMQVLFDSHWRIATTRPLPMFSVPGNMDRF